MFETFSARRAFVFFLTVMFSLLTVAAAQDSTVGSDQGPSLADQARKARKDHTQEVQMSEADAKDLFQSVETILDFAAEDTGFAKKGSIKRRLVGRAEVEKYTRDMEAKEDFAKRFASSELTMKKFGLLPRDFDLKEFLVKANGKQIAAYYDFETKTISMLNWIPRNQQEPILAHELTHALQDQNYDLQHFLKFNASEEKPSDDEDRSETAMAHHAVTEGQAQVVYVDYILKPYGRTVQNTPALIYQMEDPMVKAVADSEFLHNAPMLLREAGTFPYGAGLIFEGELLHKGGKEMAFAGAFTDPPRSTHEILNPKAYINHEKVLHAHFPDLQSVVGAHYTVFDSGGVGQLDAKAMIEQFGNRKEAEDIASAWQGGKYVAFRRAENGSKDATTSDIAFVYVSHWASTQAAQRFAKVYVGAVGQRYKSAAAQSLAACSGSPCPVAAANFSTEEGPVLIEEFADNSVVVSESFDQDTAAKLVNAVRSPNADTRADNPSDDELSMRLYEAPGFAAFQEQIGQRVREEIAKQLAAR